MNRISEAGLNLIKGFESFQPKAYLCPAGYKTIGYGHVIKSHERLPELLTKSEANELLLYDVAAAERAVQRLVGVQLLGCQYDALVSFTFNLGSGALQRSSLRRKVNREEHNEVPRELMKWVRAGGRILKGLVLRRQAEGWLYSQ